MSLTQKKHQFQVDIRKKNLRSRLTELRSVLFKQNSKQQQQEIVYQKAKSLVQSLNEQNILVNLSKIKSFSYQFNEKLIILFVQVINKLCEVIPKLDDLKQFSNKQQKDNIYNDILTIFINASCQLSYKWPKQQYLPIIKNILVDSRQINTLWFLANLLYLQNQTSEMLCRQLIKYDTIKYCQNRFHRKMNNQNDLIVLAFYICSFLTNSKFLFLNQYKQVILLIQNLISLKNQEIDWLISQSLIDHGSNLKNLNTRFGQYCKMKKFKIVEQYLQFLKTYLKSQLNDLFELQKQNNSKLSLENKQQKETKQNFDKQLKKKYLKNYERFATTCLLNITYCIEIRSPSVKCQLLELCSILVQNYFDFIDFENQIIYLTLAGQLHKLINSPLGKYNGKTIFNQLRYTSILLVRIISGKQQNQHHFSQILQDFMKQNNILVILTQIIKEKEQQQIINEACTLLYYLIASFNYLKGNVQQSILQDLIIALQTSLSKIKNQELFNKMENLLKSIQQIQI